MKIKMLKIALKNHYGPNKQKSVLMWVYTLHRIFIWTLQNDNFFEKVSKKFILHSELENNIRKKNAVIFRKLKDRIHVNIGWNSI